MPGEVSYEAFVVEFEQSEGVIDFRAGEEDLSSMVREACQVNAIFLAWYRLGLFALLDIENVHGLVVGGANQKFALIVKVE